MATITYGAIPATTEPKEDGFFTRLVNSMMAARTRQAEAYVSLHLLSLDDEELQRLGRTRAELEQHRAPIALF